MFEDDDDIFNDDWDRLQELLAQFELIKNGSSAPMLNEEDYEALIEYFFSNGEEREAILACDIATTYYPFSPDILLLKAEILTQAQKMGQALLVLDQLEETGHKTLDSVLLRSEILVSQGKAEHAVALLEEHSDAFDKKENIELLLELSDVYDEIEEVEKVFDTLARVIKIDKRNEEALQKICFWAEFSDNLEASVALHKEVTDEDPYNALAWFNLGAAYQGLKLYEMAIDSYEFCVAIDEKFEYAYRNMADAYMRLKWYEKALEVLEKHLEITKPEDVIFEAMGYCWEKKKDYTKARYYYRQAVQLNPQDDTIFYKIGETYTREKQWERAAKAFGTAVQLNKDNAHYLIALGNALTQMDAFHDAITCFVSAVRIKPNSKTGWTALIKGLFLLEEYEDALIQIEIASEYCHDDYYFIFYRAAALIELGKIKDALTVIEDGMQHAPKKIKDLIGLNPEYLHRAQVAEIISKYKKK